MNNNGTVDVSVTMQVFGFFIILLIILIAYKYYVSTYEMPVSVETTTNDAKVINKVRCPPKGPDELKMYKHSDAILPHKNELNNSAVKIQMYKEGDDVTADGFEKAVYTPIHQEFAPELEDVYARSIATPHLENNNPYIKANKSDLPIANVPYFLLQDDKPLRLSEKPM
jgi:hypothetical protein